MSDDEEMVLFYGEQLDKIRAINQALQDDNSRLLSKVKLLNSEIVMQERQLNNAINEIHRLKYEN